MCQVLKVKTLALSTYSTSKQLYLGLSNYELTITWNDFYSLHYIIDVKKKKKYLKKGGANVNTVQASTRGCSTTTGARMTEMSIELMMEGQMPRWLSGFRLKRRRTSAGLWQTFPPSCRGPSGQGPSPHRRVWPCCKIKVFEYLYYIILIWFHSFSGRF